MNEKRTKILTVVAVLLMTGAILATVPFMTGGVNGDENGNITINVQDTDNNPVNGYYVELYDILNDAKFVYNDLSFTTTLKDIPPGHYEIVFPTQEIGNKVYFRSSGLISVEPAETNATSFTLSYVVENLSVNGTVKSQSGDLLANATVTISDVNSDFSKQVKTNETGYYETTIYGGRFLISIEYAGYVINYTYINISADITVNGTLRDTPYIWGSVLDENNEVLAGEVNIILYDKNNKTTIFYTSDTGAYMVSIYKGNFSMFITADGYNLYYNPSVDCDGSSIAMGSIPLTKAVTGKMDYGISFVNDDFNTISVYQMWKIAPAHTINALPGSQFGNLRLQIDYAFGNMDGQVDTAERNAFVTWLDEHMIQVSSAELLSVNGTYYGLNTVQNIIVENIAGSVDSDAPAFINSTFEMSSYNDITASSEIPVRMVVNYDSPARDYRYALTLPAGYERTQLSAPSNVDVSGFVSIDINPSEGTGTGTVSFTAEKSLAGNASINVATGEYVYERRDANDTYIVKKDKKVSFNAIFTDPNGNEDYANYTWNFGDGETAYGKSVEHAFSRGGEYTVTLTVYEADGEANTTTADVIIQVDDIEPTPVIDANMTTVDENQAIEFNASASSDYVFGTTEGIVLSYHWDFGDDATSTQKVVEHTYDTWGTYTVTLNVTDAVGNYAVDTITITVVDITPPVPKFNWTVGNETKEDTGGTISLKEGDTVEFDATPSYDPDGFHEDEKGEIRSYQWALKDGDTTLSSSTTAILTYTFDTPGTYTLELNVTDAVGNYKEISRLVEVKYGPRPRLEVNNLTLSTNSPAEGETIYIIANVSNFGDDYANSPNVVFYVNGDALGGEVKFYKYENGSLVETGASIPNGEYRIVKIAWTPTQGTYVIKVNATDPMEPTGSSITHEKEIKVTVGPAAWMGMIPVIILLAVIGAIVGLYYMYTKGIGPFGEHGGKQEKSKKKEKK